MGLELDSTAIESLATEALICLSSFDMEVELVKALSLMRMSLISSFRALMSFINSWIPMSLAAGSTFEVVVLVSGSEEES